MHCVFVLSECLEDCALWENLIGSAYTRDPIDTLVLSRSSLMIFSPVQSTQHPVVTYPHGLPVVGFIWPIYKMKSVDSVNAAATLQQRRGRSGLYADKSCGQVPSPLQAPRPVKWGRWKWSSLKVLRALHLNVLMESVIMLSCRCIEGFDCWKEKKHTKINGPVSLEDSLPTDTSCLFLFRISASSWRLSYTIWLFLFL